MKELHLTLKKKWFDMIASGEKKEEYREVKPYWQSRLCWSAPGKMGGDFMDQHKVIAYTFWFFDRIVFKNGYAKNAPSLTFSCFGIDIKEGRPEWGAEPGKKYFVIKLGERIDAGLAVSKTEMV